MFCGCDRLGAVREPLELGAPIICGQCGGLMVLDLVEIDEAMSPTVRRPTREESIDLHRDPDVVRFLDAYALETIRRAATTSEKRKGRVIAQPGRLTAHGPDYRGST